MAGLPHHQLDLFRLLVFSCPGQARAFSHAGLIVEGFDPLVVPLVAPSHHSLSISKQ
jgi:hypothetical protein